MAKEKEREITIIDRRAPRVAIQITEISVDAKKKTRRRQSVAHLTVTIPTGTRLLVAGEEARRIIIKAIERAGGR